MLAIQRHPAPPRHPDPRASLDKPANLRLCHRRKGKPSMVKRLRLNDESVRECEPEVGRDYQVFDTEVRGFSIRILRSGNRFFYLDYRFAGAQRRMSIGRWPEWTVTAARERARELRRLVDEGGDPLGAGCARFRPAG